MSRNARVPIWANPTFTHPVEPGPKQEEPRVYTVAEVAAILRVSKDTVYEAIRTGRLYAVKLGRRLIVPRRVVEDLIGGPPVAKSETTRKK